MKYEMKNVFRFRCIIINIKFSTKNYHEKYFLTRKFKTKIQIMRYLLLIIFVGLSTQSDCQTKYLKSRIKEQKKNYKIIGVQNQTPLKTLDNRTFELNDFKGKYIVVDFWFTKCAPCFREFPHLDKIKQRYLADTNLIFVNICSISSEAEWRKVIQEKSITGIHLFDENTQQMDRRLIGSPKPNGQGTIHDQLYLNGYPGYAFLNDEGTILGATNVSPSDSILFAYYIDGLLQNKSIEESFHSFFEEINKKETSKNFNDFLKKRFGIDAEKKDQIIAVYRKVL